MKKLQKEFTFHYPLKRRVVRNLRMVTEEVGELVVEGVGYFDPASSPFTELESRYAADIDTIKWNGTDIKPVLETGDMLEEIEEATLRFCAALFAHPVEKAA